MSYTETMEKYYLNKNIYITSNDGQEGCIILDTINEEYFVAEGLYAVVLNLCKKGATLDDVITFIHQNYETVDKKEVMSIIYEYTSKGWVKCI